jgi:hypothetical protein
MGAARWDASVWLVEAHACGQGACIESELEQGFEKKAVLLEAIAASSGQNEFLEDGFWVEQDGQSQQHIDIFERDRLGVGSGQGVKHIDGGRVGALICDAVEVVFEVD